MDGALSGALNERVLRLDLASCTRARGEVGVVPQKMGCSFVAGSRSMAPSGAWGTGEKPGVGSLRGRLGVAAWGRNLEHA